jgi:hypothetical protein
MRTLNPRSAVLACAILAACTSATQAAGLNGMLFLHHFDGPAGAGGGDADYAAGVATQQFPLPFGNGGQIVSSPAKFGNSMLRGNGFDVGGRLMYQTANNFNLASGTIDMWINSSTLSTAGDFQGLWGTRAAVGAGDLRFYIYNTGAGRTLGAYMIGDDGTPNRWEVEQPIPSASLTDNVWHHVAWEWDLASGKTATFWDGQVLRNTASFGNVHYTGSTLPTLFSIGENQFGSGTFQGYIDEFRISDVMRYNGTSFTPPTAPYPIGTPTPGWGVDASGNWTDAPNWIGGVPNAPAATATFGAVITAPRTVTLASAVTVGAIRFENANAYAVVGTGTITLSDPVSGLSIVDALGSHSIANPLAVNSSGTIEVTRAQDVLTLSGSMTSIAGVQLSKSGAGTLSLKHARVDSLNVTAGKVTVLPSATAGDSAGTSRVKSLSLASGSTLDLTNNGLVIDYDGASPLTTIKNYVATGAAGTGGIVSSSTASRATAIGFAEATTLPGSPTTFLGQPIDSTSVVMRWTYSGDADLNGTVNFDDLLRLAARYNQAGTWSQGDFNNDGVVNFDDLLKLAANYNAPTLAGDWALAQSAVPEPVAMTALLGTFGALLRAKRQRRPGR